MRNSDDLFFRFPHTPHLLWLGEGAPRQDKLLDPAEAERFFRSDVIVEEKVDGTNLGFSVGESGTVRAQRRGDYVDPRRHPEFAPLRQWMAKHESALTKALGLELILFGEWCVAVHSIEYGRLPDWFLAFDVFDRTTKRSWSVDRRAVLCRKLGLAQVPVLGTGQFDRKRLTSLLGPSKLGAPLAEGLYVRVEDGDHLAARAKIVAPQFQQSIAGHWSNKTLRLNHLARRGPA